VPRGGVPAAGGRKRRKAEGMNENLADAQRHAGGKEGREGRREEGRRERGREGGGKEGGGKEGRVLKVTWRSFRR
jgi:hypothetical protein